MNKDTNKAKKQSKWAWTITIIVSVIAILSAVIGLYGLTQGYSDTNLKITWLSVTTVILGIIIAVLSWLTFSQRISSRNVWAWMQVVWTLAAMGLIIIGVLGSIEINSKQGYTWLPICITINGGLLLIDKINYLINHFIRINGESKKV